MAGALLGSVAAIAAVAIILLTGWSAADPLLSVLAAVRRRLADEFGIDHATVQIERQGC